MTEQDRLLLLEDLCARLPYGVHCIVYKMNGDIREEDDTIRYIELDNVITYKSKDDECFMLYQIKPYLRPMSSMTEKEYETFPIPYSFDSLSTWNNTILSEVIEGTQILIGIDEITEIINWLNAHHFDYRGLIEKGLALPAPEGMYND